jgi:hypothetical protein
VVTCVRGKGDEEVRNFMAINIGTIRGSGNLWFYELLLDRSDSGGEIQFLRMRQLGFVETKKTEGNGAARFIREGCVQEKQNPNELVQKLEISSQIERVREKNSWLEVGDDLTGGPHLSATREKGVGCGCWLGYAFGLAAGLPSAVAHCTRVVGRTGPAQVDQQGKKMFFFPFSIFFRNSFRPPNRAK